MVSILLAGCAATEKTRGAAPAGFLKDYSQLQAGKGKEAQLIYINPDANFGAYDKVLLDPVAMHARSESSLSKISPENLQVLEDYLYAALRRELGKVYTIVDGPGPGVLRVRAAITEVRGAKVPMNILSTVSPQAQVLDRAKKLGTGTYSFAGRAAVEGEVTDSLTGKRLIAAVDERVGGKAPHTKLGAWNDVKKAYDYWADRLRRRMEELREEK